MITIKLPDGSTKHFKKPLTIYEIAQSISGKVATAAIAGVVNDHLVDTSFNIETDSNVTIVTAKHPESLNVIRHSTAHLLAQAVKTLFPKAQITIGPVIDDGFYYDFAFHRAFTMADLEIIEAKMHELANACYVTTRQEISRAKAIAYFRGIGEEYKAKIIEDLSPQETLSLYKQGNFVDLCRGPHVPHTGFLKTFKLTKVAGAYWRGDSRNEMLQRIYGTAWLSQKELETYIYRLQEAEKRDHRKLGKILDLFHFQDLAPGMAFWHPKGWTIYQIIQHYMQQRVLGCDYQEIKTPQLIDQGLWEKSGHWDNFHESMFFTETENRQYAIKPMSCPGHVQVFNQGIKSYRDLPVRFAEFGNCHRCEPSGALHGLLRVRNFVQDDGHVFCTNVQIQAEVVSILALVQSVYTDFGFTDIKYRLALRPAKRMGSDVVWDKAEESLKMAMTEMRIQWDDAPGEGAFYGPKIECSLADSLNRIWQCGTIQLDFSTPAKLEANYIAEDGSKQTPVMIHRAILGSLERFIGIVLEHYAGRLPLWLAPVQAVVIPITVKHHDFAQHVANLLQKNAIRNVCDLRNEKIGFKIREHTLQKISYFLVIGNKEIEAQAVSVRKYNGNDLGVISINNIIELLQEEIRTKEYYWD